MCDVKREIRTYADLELGERFLAIALVVTRHDKGFRGALLLLWGEYPAVEIHEQVY